MEEKDLEEAKKVKREQPTLEDAVRIRSVPRTILQLTPEKKFVFARCGRTHVGDLLKDKEGREFLVVGDVPPGKKVQRLDLEKIDNQRRKLPSLLKELTKDPNPDKLMSSQKNDTWTLKVGFKPDITEMEYSYRLTAYRYSSTKSDLKPWIIDAMFSKTRWSEEEIHNFAGEAPVITYGFCRWSKTGYLRYHILSAFPYTPEGDSGERG